MRGEKESVGAEFEEHFRRHAEDEHVFGELEAIFVHHAVSWGLEEHGNARTGRHQNHDPVQIWNESQQLVHLTGWQRSKVRGLVGSGILCNIKLDHGIDHCKCREDRKTSRDLLIAYFFGEV